MKNKDYFKIKYAELLSVSDDQQIVKHLDHINDKGYLVFLVSGVINFWIDYAEQKDNARNADLALRKLSSILNNLDITVIEKLLNELHDHEVKDLLTDFLMKDIKRLLGIYHLRRSAKSVLKFCFLMNFLDHKNLANILSELTGKELFNIINNEKTKVLFTRLLVNVQKYGGLSDDIFSKQSYLIALSSQVQKHELDDVHLYDLNIKSNFKSLLKAGNSCLSDMENQKGVQAYSVLSMVNNYKTLLPGIKKFFENDIMPGLQKSSFGRLCLKKAKIQLEDKKMVSLEVDVLIQEVISGMQREFKEIFGVKMLGGKKRLEKYEQNILDNMEVSLREFKEEVKVPQGRSLDQSMAVKKLDKDKGKVR